MSESKKQTVLLVDDDPELLELLQTELSSEFHVLTAQSGEQGLVKALLHKPDIVISDINMPDLNGWELCYLMRQIPSTRATPFVFLSSRSQLPDRIKSFRLGADDFIAKPFSLESVASRIRGVLGRVRTRQQVVSGMPLDFEVNALMIDLLEYLRAMRRSGVIEFSRIDQNGHITLHKGILTEAQFEEMHGEPALRSMLQIGAGEISFKERETQEEKPLIADWTGFIASFLPPE
jgi:DNA-binding response OmpR family regulator